MIKVHQEIDGIEETITNNVYLTVVKDIIKSFGVTESIPIKKDPTQVIKKKNPDGTVSTLNSPLTEYVEASYTEKPEENNDLALTMLHTNKTPIYKDKDIFTNITPLDINYTGTINLKYYNASKSEITKIVNRLHTSLSLGKANFMHDLSYYYIIPPMVIKLLIHLNNLKNLRVTAPVSFEEYLQTTFDNRLTMSLPKDNLMEKINLAIQMIQSNVLGYYDDNPYDSTVQKDDDNGLWYVELSYSFTYSKQTALLCQYPILIYNTLIKKEFRNFINKDYKLPAKGNINLGDGSLMRAGIGYDASGFNNNNKHFMLPDYDYSILEEPQTSLVRFLSVLMKVKPNDNYVLNIKNLPSKTLSFRESIVRYLLSNESEYVGIMHESLIYINLYRNFVPDNSVKIKMDTEGNIFVDKELDIKSIYHLSFNMVTDLDMLSDVARKRVIAYIKNELSNILDGIYTIDDSIFNAFIKILNIPDSVIKSILAENDNINNVIFKVNEWICGTMKTKQVYSTTVHAFKEIR